MLYGSYINFIVVFLLSGTLFAASNPAINCPNCESVNISNNEIVMSDDRVFYSSEKSRDISFEGNKVLIYSSKVADGFYSKGKHEVFYNKKYLFDENSYSKYMELSGVDLVDLANDGNMHAIFIYSIFLLEKHKQLEKYFQNNFASKREFGSVSLKYRNDAIQLLRLSASKGHTDSSAIAGSLAKQFGAYEQAVDLLSESAAHGSALAQYKLGLMYATGEGVSKNYKKAQELFRSSASKGFAMAQYDYGIALINEDKNKEGYRHILAAANNGSVDAIKFFKGCGSKTAFRLFCSNPPCGNGSITGNSFEGSMSAISFNSAGLSSKETMELNLLISNGDPEEFDRLQSQNTRDFKLENMVIDSNRFNLVSCNE